MAHSLAGVLGDVSKIKKAVRVDPRDRRFCARKTPVIHAAQACPGRRVFPGLGAVAEPTQPILTISWNLMSEQTGVAARDAADSTPVSQRGRATRKTRIGRFLGDSSC